MSLFGLVKAGLVKSCLVEFRAADYYREKEHGRPEHECIARGAGFETPPTAKVEKLRIKLARYPDDADIKQELDEAMRQVETAMARNARQAQIQEDVRRYIAEVGISSSCVTYMGQSPVLPVPSGSMRQVFMSYFFDPATGRYKKQTYPEYIKGLEHRDMTEVMRGLMLQAVHILVRHTKIGESGKNIGAPERPPQEWEVAFIHDEVW
jgi:hypothetical protein